MREWLPGMKESFVFLVSEEVEVEVELEVEVEEGR